MSLLQIQMRLRGAREASAQIQGVSASMKGLAATSKAATASALSGMRKMLPSLAALKSAGLAMQSTGRSMTRSLTVPIVAAGGLAVKAFADFDGAMNESLAIMGDLSSGMRTKLEVGARDVAKTTKFSAKEAAESYFFLASAGLDAAQSLEALPAVARFGQAGMFNMSTATDLLTDAQSALGMTVDDAGKNLENMTRVSDTFVKANTLANTSVQQVSEAFTNKAGASLRILNKDVEEGTAVLAAFADQGVKGNLAGNSLAIVLRDLQTASLKNSKAFKEMGVSVYDSEGNMRHMGTVIADLEGLLEGMSDKQVKATLSQLGFQDRSMQFLMTLIGTSDAIKEYDKALRGANGITREISDKQMKTFKEQLGLAKDALIDVGIVIGGTLAPFVLKLANFIVGLFVQFQKLPKPVQTTILVFAGVLAIAGPLLMILGKMVLGIYGLGVALKFLAANPVILIVAGIIALVAGLIWAYHNVEVFRNVVDTAFNAIKDVVGAVVGFIVGHWELLLLAFGPFGLVLLTIIKNFDSVKAAAEWAFNAVIDVVVWAFNGIKNHFVQKWLPILDLLTKPIRAFVEFAGPYLKWFGELVLSILDSIIGWAGSIWPDVKKFLEDPIGNAIRFIVTNFDNMLDFVKSLPGRVKSAASGLWEGLKDGLKPAIDWIRDKIDSVRSTIDDVRGALDFIPGIDGPSDAPSGPGRAFNRQQDNSGLGGPVGTGSSIAPKGFGFAFAGGYGYDRVTPPPARRFNSAPTSDSTTRSQVEPTKPGQIHTHVNLNGREIAVAVHEVEDRERAFR